MSMQFKPKTEKEIQEAQLWPKGEYDFEVIKAEAAKSGPNSKTPGTEFIKLELSIWDNDGLHRYVRGILHPAMDAQLRHFCFAGNLPAEYEAGTLTAEQCVGVAGKLKLKIKPEENGYPAKNEVQDYITEKAARATKAGAITATAEPPESDDVPF